MREADCSNKKLARLVREIGERDGKRLGTGHTAVSRWLNGKVRAPRIAPYIAEALSGELGRAVTLQEIGFGHTAPLPHGLGLSYSGSADETVSTLERLLRADIEDAAVLNRPAQGTVWQETPLTWLVAPPRELVSNGSGRRVGSSDVQAFGASLTLFRQMDDTHGGGYARNALIAFLHKTLAPLLAGAFNEDVGRSLFASAGEAAVLAAWMSYDAGQHSRAQRYFVQAIGLADAAGTRALGGTVLSAMSHQATYLGHAQDATNLARAALLGASTYVSQTQRAQIHAMEARALARLGDARGCDHALTEATTALEQADTDAPEWITYFNEPELYAEIGHCFRDLGRSAMAARYAEQSVNGGCGPRSDFFAEMVAADAYRAAGEYEQATATALRALRLGEQLDSRRCLTYVDEFRRNLPTDDTSSIIHDFIEQVEVSPLWQQTDPSTR